MLALFLVFGQGWELVLVEPARGSRIASLDPKPGHGKPTGELFVVRWLSHVCLSIGSGEVGYELVCYHSLP